VFQTHGGTGVFRRFPPRWLPLRFLGALLMIATALVLGAQLRKLDGMPLGRPPDRFEMITALPDPTAADIPSAALTGAADATTVGRAPSTEEGTLSQPARTRATPVARGAMGPGTLAQEPHPSWNRRAEPTPGQKYTGAGRAFDAVH
jgi:hypothetical protein